VSQALVQQLSAMGIRDERVLRAFDEVPRRLFVPGWLQDQAEADRPLPIGHGQTISQPYIVALMTQVLRLEGGERVLEIGTGSGYQAAILARLAREVFSIEILPELAASAAAVLLGTLHLPNVHLRTDDGRRGWPDAAPFDRIIVTAAPADIPAELVGQLAAGGLMVIPVGSDPEVQMLKVLRRGSNGVDAVSDLLPVRFVPLTGDPT
jgi:protein-L-isoaspartate(D-aspartate) O-methyltransferase